MLCSQLLVSQSCSTRQRGWRKLLNSTCMSSMTSFSANLCTPLFKLSVFVVLNRYCTVNEWLCLSQNLLTICIMLLFYIIILLYYYIFILYSKCSCRQDRLRGSPWEKVLSCSRQKMTSRNGLLTNWAQGRFFRWGLWREMKWNEVQVSQNEIPDEKHEI